MTCPNSPGPTTVIQRVLAVPAKRKDHPDISYLTRAEIDALLAAPDLTTRLGRRDRALLAVAVQTGLRASELVGLRRHDVTLGTGAHLTCTGKGRKQRTTPLTAQTAAVVSDWLHERGGGLGGERCGALLPSLAGAGEVRPGAQGDVMAAQPDEFRCPQPGLDSHGQQRPVPPTETGSEVRRCE